MWVLLDRRNERPSDGQRSLDRRLLYRYFGFEAIDVAGYRSGGEHLSVAFEPQDAVLGCDVAFDHKLVPMLGMADIADLDVIMLTPEERNGCVSLAVSQHSARGGLTLTLGDNPMFDANSLAGM